MNIGNGLIMVISGIALFIGTVIWIYIDDKNKEKRNQELLKKIDASSSNVKTSSITSINDTTEMLDDSTELLDTTEII